MKERESVMLEIAKRVQKSDLRASELVSVTDWVLAEKRASEAVGVTAIRTLEYEAGVRDQRIEDLERVMRRLLASANPHPVEHSTMWSAWKEAEDLLSIPEEHSHRIQTADKALEDKR